ncbi:MAG: 16S rRNA (guanine(966)-N(2))-methyltransferase RsmD [Nitrospiraceae bacterium]|nr:16S rRNA (guanine(966)-N(2))-methyltransferase RsmD [Nitrospiraceae bacterium]
MRVIAGTAKGTRLAAPKGLQVRPTLDRVRESLFNILGPRIAGARFLDLFAGTGANGIEALSRGADRAVFVDQDQRSLGCVRHNLEATHLSTRAVLHRLSLSKAMAALRADGLFDIVFADPPYAFQDYSLLLELSADDTVLAPEGVVVIEHDIRAEIPGATGRLSQYRTGKYGDTALSFFA